MRAPPSRPPQRLGVSGGKSALSRYHLVPRTMAVGRLAARPVPPEPAPMDPMAPNRDAPTDVSPPPDAAWLAIGERICSWSDALARHTEDSTALTRTYLTGAHHGAAGQIRAWMEEAGMQVRRDAVGNIIGRYEGERPDAPALLTGSHFDSVRNAGKYDGTLGILLPIALVGLLHAQRRRLPHALEVIGFAEEEGVRFKSTLLGSRALAGTFDTSVLGSRDEAGTTLEEVIDNAGLGFDHHDIFRAAYRPEQVLGFVEVHIEQGPVLLNAALPVGIVTAIAGASRYMIDLAGEAGHSGTVPMDMRRDAAMAACAMALELESYCRARSELVGTVGLLEIPHGTANVVPGRARFSIDIRSSDDAIRLQEVVDRGALLQELGVGDDVELVLRSLGHLGAHAGGSAHRHRALVDDHGVAPQRFANLAGRGEHVLEVGFAGLALRRADGDEDDVALRDARSEVGGEGEGVGEVFLRGEVRRVEPLRRSASTGRRGVGIRA